MCLPKGTKLSKKKFDHKILNADICAIYEDTSKGTNVQYDTFQSTRNVIKSIRKTKEDRVVQEYLQVLTLSFLLKDVLSSTIKLWSVAQSFLPWNIFNFTVRYLNNSLPTRKNMVTWGQSNESSCSACAEIETLLHVARPTFGKLVTIADIILCFCA